MNNYLGLLLYMSYLDKEHGDDCATKWKHLRDTFTMLNNARGRTTREADNGQVPSNQPNTDVYKHYSSS